MVSGLYASLCALLILWLSMNVIKLRQRHGVNTGDGSNDELKIAMIAQSNAIEYVPIALLLLYALEFNEGDNWLVNLLGISFVLGRIIHARGVLTETLRIRVLGTQVTFYTIMGLVVTNVIFLPYGKLFHF